jgi:hypothetical protein
MNEKRKTRMAQLAERAQTIIDRANSEGRARTEDEAIEISGIHAELKRLDEDGAIDDQIERLGKSLGPGSDSGPQNGWAKVAQQIAGDKAAPLRCRDRRCCAQHRSCVARI